MDDWLFHSKLDLGLNNDELIPERGWTYDVLDAIKKFLYHY